MIDAEQQQQQQQHASALDEAMASDDEEDYVPDSLREMFADADRQLEYFLDSNTHAADPVPDGHNHFFNDDDDDDDDNVGPNSSMIDELGAVVVVDKEEDRRVHQRQQQDDEQEAAEDLPDDAVETINKSYDCDDDDRDVNDSVTASSLLLDIMHPSSSNKAARTTPEITDSEVKHHMRGAEIVPVYDDDDDDSAEYKNETNRQPPMSSSKAPTATVGENQNDDGGAMNHPTPPPSASSSSTFLMQQVPPSTSSSLKGRTTMKPDVSTLKVGRKLQSELDREARLADLPPSSSSPSASFGLRRRRNIRVAPVNSETTRRLLSIPPSSQQQRQSQITERGGRQGKDAAVGVASDKTTSQPSLPAKVQRQQQRQHNQSGSSLRLTMTMSSPSKPKPFKARPAPTPPKPEEIRIPTQAGDGIPAAGTLSNHVINMSPLGGIKGDDGDHSDGEELSDSPRKESSDEHNDVEIPTKSAQQSTSLSRVGVFSTTDKEEEEHEDMPGRRPLTKPDQNLGRLTQPTLSSANSTMAARSEKPSPSKVGTNNTASGTNSMEQNTTMSKGKQLSKISSRLLKPTASVMARQNGGVMTISSAQVLTVKTTITKANGSSYLEASRNKARLRARMEARKVKSVPVQTKLNVARSKDADERLKASRERKKRLEDERMAKLREKINAKQNRTEGVVAAREEGITKRHKETIRDRNQRLSDRKSNVNLKVGPTIPITPKFATDRRMHHTEPAKKREEEMPTLANSTDVLIRGLRAPLPKRLQATSYQGKKQLTVPSSPKFETTKRHPVTKPVSSSPGKNIYADDISWSSSLRDKVLSPISKVGSVGGSGLTIPKGPKFQPIRKRPLPKSTAEREEEEMAHFRSHPFRACPATNRQQHKSISSRRPVASQKTTTPEPFHFRVDRRANSTRTGKQTHVEEISRTTIKTGIRGRATAKNPSRGIAQSTKGVSSLPRRLTTPKPFHLHTDSRAAADTPQVVEQMQSGAHANVPSGSAGVPFRRRALASPDDAVQYKPFKARPMPNFIAKSNSANEGDGSPTKSSKRNESIQDANEGKGRFRARPMPNFDRITTPVHRQLRSPLRKIAKEDDVETEPFQFHAKPVPEAVFSPPKIPVRPRDPSKLRSPDSVKRSESPQSKEDKSVQIFSARPAPAFLGKEPTIPVCQRDSSKLRSPEKVKILPKSHASKESPSPLRASLPKILLQASVSTKLRSPTSSTQIKDTNASIPTRTSVISQPNHLPPKVANSSGSNVVVKSQKPVIDATPLETLADADSMEGLMGVSPVKTPSVFREENRRRIQERIASRKKKGPSPVKLKTDVGASSSTVKSPPAFTSSKVRDKLNRGKEQLAEKMKNQRNDAAAIADATSKDSRNGIPQRSPDDTAAVDISIESMVDDVLGTTLDLRLSSDRKEKHRSQKSDTSEGNVDAPPDRDISGSEVYADAITPKFRNATDRPATEGGIMDDDALRRQVELACAEVQPDGDESASVLQLAQQVQRLAEDELSFHGSIPSRSPDGDSS